MWINYAYWVVLSYFFLLLLYINCIFVKRLSGDSHWGDWNVLVKINMWLNIFIYVHLLVYVNNSWTLYYKNLCEKICSQEDVNDCRDRWVVMMEMVMTSIIMVMNCQFPSSFKFWGCENVFFSLFIIELKSMALIIPFWFLTTAYLWGLNQLVALVQEFLSR